MDLIYTDSNGADLGVIRAYNFDLAFGSDENNFELKIDTDNHCCEAGCYVYVEGTEYGGIIDAVASDTAAEEVTYTGRTWHGILNSKVLCPDSGQDYLTLNGNANTVLGTLISRMGLTSIFEASSDASDLTISSYKMERYITGYDGIRKMLNSVNGKLVMSYNGTKVILSAVPIVDYTDAGVIDSDIMSFSVKKTSRKVNHLICLGQGELKDRTVVHLYADTSGSISQTQTLTGLDEYTAVYDNSNAESIEKLREAGSEQLAELQKQDDLSVSLSEGEDVFDVGDIVGAVDNVTGIAISVPISKKIISIQNDYLSAAYETEISKVRTSNSGQINGSGEITSAAQRPTVMIAAQIDTTDDYVQMDDQDAYDKIKTADENGSTVTLVLYYSSSEYDILPLVTVGTDYFSFAATTGYYFSPGHNDSASISNIMVTVHADNTAHYYANHIFER